MSTKRFCDICGKEAFSGVLYRHFEGAINKGQMDLRVSVSFQGGSAGQSDKSAFHPISDPDLCRACSMDLIKKLLD